MAKPLITADLVGEAAEALLARGEEPTIITVQQAIGGGSYTSVKKYLDAWKIQKAATPQVEIPGEIDQQARQLARGIWGIALNQSEQRTAHLREEAARHIEEMRVELATAEKVISTQERHIEAQTREFEEAHTRIQELQQALQVAEARAIELERQRDAAQAQAETAQTTLLTQARELGELDALRRQVGEQAQMLERLASNSKTNADERPGAEG